MSDIEVTLVLLSIRYCLSEVEPPPSYFIVHTILETSASVGFIVKLNVNSPSLKVSCGFFPLLSVISIESTGITTVSDSFTVIAYSPTASPHTT